MLLLGGASVILWSFCAMQRALEDLQCLGLGGEDDGSHCAILFFGLVVTF